MDGRIAPGLDPGASHDGRGTAADDDLPPFPRPIPLRARAAGGTMCAMNRPAETTVEDIARAIGDGALLALPKPEAGAAMAAVRALVRRGAKGLRLWCLPASGLPVDLLVGAGCVSSVECSGVSLGELGAAPRFRLAAESGAVRVVDSTCQAMYAAAQAGEKGMPFVALRGIVGSDILTHRDDWRVMQNPFASGEDPVVVLPAIRPDMALIHARLRDSCGNLWVGNAREAIVLAHAARRTVATFEAHHEGNLLDDDRMAAGTIAPVYVEAAAHAPRGAWPLALPGAYAADRDCLAEYAAAAASEDGFAAWLARHLPGAGAAA